MKNVKVPQTGASCGAQARRQATARNRILVVDDDIGFRLLSTELLVGSGYQVATAEDGLAAWATLQANGYDLLITDNNIPKVSGLELVKEMRCAHMTLPVILASGALPTDELKRHPWLQPIATLVKPCTGGQLLETLDQVLAPTGELASAPTQGRANPYNRILVADDDADVRQVSADVLSRFGYQTETASDGAAAWEALEANSYDLLITDNNLPKVSGVELIKKVRSAHMTLPVILASAALPAEEVDLPWLQSVATLIKPFSSGSLLETCYWRICVRCKLLSKPVSVSDLLDTVEEVLAQPTVSTATPGPAGQ